ncbi:MAG: hypothetical protein IPG75_10070 [Gemmatimonadetes bacterium]|nr:hypothetical protein [Gemmatimonadota bacterium]
MKSPEGAEPSGIYALNSDERRAMALALLARPQRGKDGLAAFHRKYPLAPAEMICTAAHHVYVDGPDAVINFLADAELAIRDPQHEIDYGPTWEVLYHLYNWLQFRAILPDGTADVISLLKQLKQAVAEDDREFIVSTAQELENVLEGSRQPPDVDTL